MSKEIFISNSHRQPDIKEWVQTIFYEEFCRCALLEMGADENDIFFDT